MEGTRDKGHGAASRVYAWALVAMPAALRARYGPEMIEAFAEAYVSRRRLGATAAWSFLRRAFVDAIGAGLRARLGRHGIRARAPRARFGRGGGSGSRFPGSQIGAAFRFATRSLARSPIFSIAVILVLALGVGINGAIFTAVRAALLAPPPFPDPQRLVFLDLAEVSAEDPGPPRAFLWSWPKYRVLAESSIVGTESIAAYGGANVTLTGRGDAVRVRAEVVSPSYFDTLGVSLLHGPGFTTGELGGAEREVILGNAIWRERFGSDPGVVGETVTLTGEPIVVVGVAPAGFRGLSGRGQVWVTVNAMSLFGRPAWLNGAQAHWHLVIGRTREGVNLDEIREQMRAVGERVEEEYPWDDPRTRLVGWAQSLADVRRNPQAQRAVLVTALASGLVLLIACANLAGLLLARGGSRRREIAVRLALGAPRLRVVRGLLVETLELAVAGGIVGIGVARLGVSALAAAWPRDFVNGSWNVRFVDAASFTMDPQTVLFTLGLALLAGLACGLWPAMRLTGHDLAASLKEGVGATRRERHTRHGGRRALVAAEVAAAVVLLIGASLMVSSLVRLLDVDHGFDSDNLLTFSYSLPPSSPARSEPGVFLEQFLSRIRRLPGVEGATSGCTPLRVHCWIAGTVRAGDRFFEEGKRPPVGLHFVDHDFFRTLGIRVVRGRTFDADVGPGTSPVVVVNEAAARELFDGEDPLGQPFAATAEVTSAESPATVIGVVSDVLYGAPEEGVLPEAYFSQWHLPLWDPDVIVRTRGAPLDLVGAIRRQLADLDPDLPIFDVTTVSALGSAQISDTRVVMALLGAFGAVALLLAATGVWAIVAYAVSQRTREIGVRMALGARAGQLLALVLRQGIAGVLAGLLVGTVVALGASRFLASLLFEVSSTDPVAYVVGAVLILVVAVVAAYVPARRATRIDPVASLRAE